MLSPSLPPGYVGLSPALSISLSVSVYIFVDHSFYMYVICYVNPSVSVSVGSICLELLPQISCPTLVVHGQKDPMVPSVHPQVLLQHIPNARWATEPDGK